MIQEKKIYAFPTKMSGLFIIVVFLDIIIALICKLMRGKSKSIYFFILFFFIHENHFSLSFRFVIARVTNFRFPDKKLSFFKSSK